MIFLKYTVWLQPQNPLAEVDEVGNAFMRPRLRLRGKNEIAVNRGGIVSAAKAHEGKKGQSRGGVYDWVIVNVYMPGVNGVTDCHPSVSQQGSHTVNRLQSRPLGAEKDTYRHTHMHRHTHTHTHPGNQSADWHTCIMMSCTAYKMDVVHITIRPVGAGGVQPEQMQQNHTDTQFWGKSLIWNVMWGLSTV